MKSDKYNLRSISGDSTLIVFLRMLYSVVADYGVYVPDDGDPVILSKGQLIFLIERGCADALIKTLPELASRSIVKSIKIETFENPEETRALFIENTGTFITTLARALNPDEPQYPEWWDAPVPFAIRSRGVLRLNPTAVQMFGNGLERLNAHELPDRDEFIVRLESPGQSRFMAFKKLRPSIFSLDDCTEDLTEAQDITWWAAVGRSWVKEIEAQGGKWYRSDSKPYDEKEESDKKKFWQCEWRGQLQGYLCAEKIINEEKISEENKKDKIEEVEKIEQNEQNTISEKTEPDKDEVLSDIGPQAMALLAAGQPRDSYEVMV